MFEIKWIEFLSKPILSCLGKIYTEVKFVVLDYPDKSGLNSKLRNKGYVARWCREDQISSFTDDGWKIYKTGFCRRKLWFHDRPFNQILIYRKIQK